LKFLKLSMATDLQFYKGFEMSDMDADVCVVGAGYAGLTAALRLTQAGQSVIVLEARDRVGGRTWTERLPDGTWVDKGGAWIGYGQDRIYALAAEMGIATYPTFKEGGNLFVIKDKAHRYHGVIPGGLSPYAALVAGLSLKRLDRLGKRIPLDTPWSANNAAKFDGQTMSRWLGSRWNVPSKRAGETLRLFMTAFFAVPPEELSMLGVLFASHALGSFELSADNKKGAHQDRIVGGMQSIAEAIARKLGDAVRLSSPVRSIRQDANGVIVSGDNGAHPVRARRVVVAIPPALSGHIRYEPLLPAERALLAHQMPAGFAIKIELVYEDAFWRKDGLCGQSVGIETPIILTFDSCAAVTPPGILSAVLAGPFARTLGQCNLAERREIVLKDLVKRFGPKAAKPVHYIEQNWSQEEWSRGGYVAHFKPGVLTALGPALRKPVARIHWAGTETATTSFMCIDGAVRSGERVAAEILAADLSLSS
jgi:monoamine oxidase